MRKYFLGGNTPKGFFSYYDYLIRQSEARKIYVLKGGPGTGKSTLMKKVALWAEEEGFDVDYIYCSSDPDSLDGLVVPEIKVALVDGTSPHIVDPKTPGAVDTIVYPGGLWNEKNMRKNKEEILSVNKAISEKFALAYEHLAAAGVLHGTIKKLHGRIAKESEIERIASGLICENVKGLSCGGTGFVRRLFASAFTPKGYISHTKTLSCAKKYILCGNAAHIITQKIAQTLTDYKYDIELFYNPLDPDSEILHIYIPETGVGIFTCEADGGSLGDDGDFIDLSVTTDKYLMEEYAEELENCRQALNVQTGQACGIIKQAKALHDKLECCYIPNMDFAGMNKIQQSIIAELEEIKG